MERVETFTLVPEGWAHGVVYSVRKLGGGLGSFSLLLSCPQMSPHPSPTPLAPSKTPLGASPWETDTHFWSSSFFNHEREKQTHSACRPLGEGAGSVWGLACLPWAWLRCPYQDLEGSPVLKPTEKQGAPVIFWWATRGRSVNTNEKRKAPGKEEKKNHPSWEMSSFSEALVPAARLAASICCVSLSLSLSVTVLSLPLPHLASHFLSGISLENMQIHLAASRFKNQLHHSDTGKV